MDKVAEMLTKIRNAQMAERADLEVGFSKLKFALAEILKKEGFIGDVFQFGDKIKKIKIILKYNQLSRTKKVSAIRGIRKISKSGQRIYVKSKDIKNVKNKYGKAIFSTSKGVMTGENSRKAGLGGEYLCEVW